MLQSSSVVLQGQYCYSVTKFQCSFTGNDCFVPGEPQSESGHAIRQGRSRLQKQDKPMSIIYPVCLALIDVGSKGPNVTINM